MLHVVADDEDVVVLLLLLIVFLKLRYFIGHFYCVCYCVQMISLYRDPTGERVFSKTMPTSDFLQSSNGTKQQRLSEVGAVVLIN